MPPNVPGAVLRDLLGVEVEATAPLGSDRSAAVSSLSYYYGFSSQQDTGRRWGWGGKGRSIQLFGGAAPTACLLRRTRSPRGGISRGQLNALLRKAEGSDGQGRKVLASWSSEIEPDST